MQSEETTETSGDESQFASSVNPSPDESALSPEPDLSGPFKSLLVGRSRIDIIGTAHVSRQSCEDVRKLMECNRYDCVATELCEKRYGNLIEEVPDLDLWAVIKQGRLGELATGLAVSAYQQRLGKQLGVEPGAEMKEAIIGAKRIGVPLLCVDREVGVTVKRLLSKLSWWKRILLIQMVVWNLFRRDQISEDKVEELKSSDTMRAMFEEIPSGEDDEFFDVLIFERDYHMACKVLDHIKQHPHSRILMVVGAGHVPGVSQVIKRYRFPPARKDLQAMMEYMQRIPTRFRWSRVAGIVIILLILMGFSIGFQQGIGLSLVGDWILINGSLAALGAVLAGGHAITVISAFFAAPLTSINPMIGAGMVTAAVEITVRKPHIRDLKNLRDDTVTFMGWHRNRIARALLVFVMSSIGSAFGTYIGGFHIFNQIS